MLEHVDRVQIAVTDRAAAAQTFIDIFDAKLVKDDEVRALGAKRRVVHAGTSEFELLEPSGVGPVQAYLNQWGEGLFAAGFSTNDVAALGVAPAVEGRAVHRRRRPALHRARPDARPADGDLAGGQRGR